MTVATAAQEGKVLKADQVHPTDLDSAGGAGRYRTGFASGIAPYAGLVRATLSGSICKHPVDMALRKSLPHAPQVACPRLSPV